MFPSYEEQIQVAGIVDEKLTAIDHLDVELDQHLSKAEKNKQSILATPTSKIISIKKITTRGSCQLVSG